MCYLVKNFYPLLMRAKYRQNNSAVLMIQGKPILTGKVEQHIKRAWVALSLCSRAAPFELARKMITEDKKGHTTFI